MAEQFVMDASVVLAWCFEDEAGPYADAVLERFAQAEALAPIIWPLEVGNALVVAERRGCITPAEAVRFLDLLRQLPISVEGETPSRLFGEILSLAREQGLSTHDAAYLDLAMPAGPWPPVTAHCVRWEWLRQDLEERASRPGGRRFAFFGFPLEGARVRKESPQGSGVAPF